MTESILVRVRGFDSGRTTGRRKATEDGPCRLHRGLPRRGCRPGLGHIAGRGVRVTHIALLRALAAWLRHTGDIDEAIRYLLQLLGQDPFDEQAHLDLINMQLGAGHLGEARRHYHIYVQQMKEIDVHPQPLPLERRRK